MEKMYAVVIYGEEDFRYEEVPKPKPGKEEVIVKVGRCGICAADPKIFHGKGYFSPIVYQNAPIIAGHEFIGEVAELGPGSKEKYGLEVADKAIAEHIIPCWECYYCKRGLYNLCTVHNIFGIKGCNGGWAEYVLYPRGSIIHKVPDDISWERGVLIEPLSCAIHGVERGNVQLGDVVVVTGDGPIGLLMLQVAKLKNPKLLILSGHHDDRLRVGKELGADVIINSAKEDIVENVSELTDERGCDIVLEATGHPSAVEQAVQILRKRGRLMVFGVFAEKVCIDFSIISDIKELEIVGGHLGPYTYPTAIRLLQNGYIEAEKIVTHNFRLKGWRRAIEVAGKRLEGAIKVTMTP